MKFYFLFTSLDTVLISHLCKVCQKKRVFHTMGLKRHFLFSSPFLSARDRYYCDVLRHWVKYLLLSSPVAGVGQSPRGRVAVPLASALCQAEGMLEGICWQRVRRLLIFLPCPCTAPMLGLCPASCLNEVKAWYGICGGAVLAIHLSDGLLFYFFGVVTPFIYVCLL